MEGAPPQPAIGSHSLVALQQLQYDNLNNIIANNTKLNESAASKPDRQTDRQTEISNQVYLRMLKLYPSFNHIVCKEDRAEAFAIATEYGFLSVYEYSFDVRHVYHHY